MKKLLFKRYAGEILLVLSTICYCYEWYIIRKLYAQKLSALDISLIRAFFTCIIIGLVFYVRNSDFLKFKSFTLRELKYVVGLSATMLLCGICFNTAIQFTTVANTLIIFYSCIFWGTLYAFFFLKEKISMKMPVLIIIAFIGICLSLIKSGSAISIQFGKGELYALLGSLIFPFDAVFSRKIRYTNTVQRLFLINIFGVIIGIIAVLSYKNINYFLIYINPDVLLHSFILALMCGFMAKWLMYAGYNRTPVSIALVILLFEPITQMTTAFISADETLSFINVIGILIVFFMVVLISKQKEKAEN
jgi:drug/metabolite transporter (DMT)-like permease